MKTVLVKYNTGNICSMLFALERSGVNAALSEDPEVIRAADKVIIPGVGEASSAMHYLRAKGLDQTIAALQQPVLGICLGMQLLCAASEEGNVDCLGIFPQTVKQFRTTDQRFKVPHMGWNSLSGLRGRLFEGLEEGVCMYFVHGFYAEKGEHTVSGTDYILPYSSALQKNNFYGVQFHPEKSGEAGERLLKNFLAL